MVTSWFVMHWREVFLFYIRRKRPDQTSAVKELLGLGRGDNGRGDVVQTRVLWSAEGFEA